MVLTRLTEVMKKKGVTVEDLASKSLMSARSICSARNGKGVPLNTGKRIAKGLNIKLEELL